MIDGLRNFYDTKSMGGLLRCNSGPSLQVLPGSNRSRPSSRPDQAWKLPGLIDTLLDYTFYSFAKYGDFRYESDDTMQGWDSFDFEFGIQ